MWTKRVLAVALLLAFASGAEPQVPPITCGYSVVWYAEIYDPTTDDLQTQTFTETSTDAGFAKSRTEEIATRGSYGLGSQASYYFPPARILRVGYSGGCS